MTDKANQAGKSLTLHAVYLIELREHALILVWLGYQRMKAQNFALAEEDAITGELIKEMKAVTEDTSSPPWVERYSVSEQVRSNAPGKLGKHRPIVDVELEQHRRGKRPRLRFEAKRLCKTSGVADYLGPEGLEAFLTSYYSRTESAAGMLGYVQTQTERIWAGKLGAKLNAPAYRIIKDGNWTHLNILSASPHIYQTIHADNESQQLFIFHTLLSFCAFLSER